jgi:hypothetical protein
MRYYNHAMEIDEAISELESRITNTRFTRLVTICETFFGGARISGSHHIFKTKWAGDPRINLQKEKGKAKTYQVEQVIRALKKLKEIQEAEKKQDVKKGKR